MGLVITNAAGRVAGMNRSAQRILGIDEDMAKGELLGRLLRDPGMAEFRHRPHRPPAHLERRRVDARARAGTDMKPSCQVLGLSSSLIW